MDGAERVGPEIPNAGGRVGTPARQHHVAPVTLEMWLVGPRFIMREILICLTVPGPDRRFVAEDSGEPGIVLVVV